MIYVKCLPHMKGFPGGSDGKEFACSAADVGSIPGSERSPGEGNGNPLQYVCIPVCTYATYVLSKLVIIFVFEDKVKWVY